MNTREKSQEQLVSVVKKTALIAGKTQSLLGYILGVGGLASVYLVYCLYSQESAYWFNAFKGFLVMSPVLVLGFFWTILGQLHDAPESLKKLNQDTRTAYSGIKQVKLREPKGLRGMFWVLNAFRREGSLGDVFDTVGSISLLVNPLFLFVLCIALVLLILLSFTALLIVLF